MAISQERVLEIIKCLYSRDAEITERIEGRYIVYGISIPHSGELWLSPEEVSFLEDAEIIECDGGGEDLRVYVITEKAREKIDEIRTDPKRLLS